MCENIRSIEMAVVRQGVDICEIQESNDTDRDLTVWKLACQNHGTIETNCFSYCIDVRFVVCR
jgi:hypothetical protein